MMNQTVRKKMQIFFHFQTSAKSHQAFVFANANITAADLTSDLPGITSLHH